MLGFAAPAEFGRYVASFYESICFLDAVDYFARGDAYLPPLGHRFWRGGHGDYFLAKLLFPFTMLSTIPFGSITVPFILLAVAQFPAYGVVLGRANEKGRFMPAACVVLAVHALAAATCLMWVGENFS
ncbi:MAG: hypothetical protein M3362_06880 [Acidobacteriota bacterium]|nr:hypothetical protein [Acidobacteriota bacterium]